MIHIPQCTEGWKLFRRERQGRRDREIALYVMRRVECSELCLRNSHDQFERLWVKIRDWTNKGYLMSGPGTGHLTRGSILTRPSCFNYKKYCTHRFSS